MADFSMRVLGNPKSEDTKFDFDILWGSGASFLYTQWFTNGTLGSTWLPCMGSLGVFAAFGQVCIYAIYCACLIALIPVYRRHGALFRRFSFAGMLIGDSVVLAVGMGFLDAPWYLVGMLVIGVSMSPIKLGYGLLYCTMGERRACMSVSLGFIVAPVLLCVIVALSSLNQIIAVIAQVLCIPFAFLFFHKAEHRVVKSSHGAQGRRTERALLRRLLPYLVTVTVIGMVFGIVVGINSVWGSGSSVLVWSIGMCAVGLMVFAVVGKSRVWSLGSISRMLMPLLFFCLFLIPLSRSAMSQVVFAVGCGGYVFSLVFYQVAYVAIAETEAMPAIPLVALAICFDSLGIVIGQTLCYAVIPNLGLSLEAVYAITFVCVFSLVITGVFFLGDKSTASLWGFKKSSAHEFSEDVLVVKAESLAIRHGLTGRETTILAMLAAALEPNQIAQDLSISMSTVRSHIKRIYMKLDVHSSYELMRRVIQEDEGTESD